MLDRRDLLIEVIRSQGEVSMAELRLQFPDVSEMTLRRDLDYLDRNGHVVRIHGGAKSIEAIVGLTEERYAKRSLQRVEEKNLIATKAIKLLKPKKVVFIDSGTTTTAFARILPDIGLGIVTSGLTCGLELARLKDSNVEIIGGNLNKTSLSAFGSRSTEQLKDANFDICFLGATGFDLEAGFTTGLVDDYELKKVVIERSRLTVLLIDSTKVGRVNTYTFARLSDVDVVVVDNEIDEETVSKMKNEGVTVL